MNAFEEGQLCPYDDCQNWVRLSGDTGWKFCPTCGQLFWYKSTDGDYEDYHCFLPDFRVDEQPHGKPDDWINRNPQIPLRGQDD